MQYVKRLNAVGLNDDNDKEIHRMDAYEIADEIIKQASKSGKDVTDVFIDVERALDMLRQHDAEEA